VVVRLDGHAPDFQDFRELDDLAVARARRRLGGVRVQQLKRASVRPVDAREYPPGCAREHEHVDVTVGHSRQVHICWDHGAHRYERAGETKAVR
jgi:hypothetical protein